jgi:hypothetical protein
MCPRNSRAVGARVKLPGIARSLQPARAGRLRGTCWNRSVKEVQDAFVARRGKRMPASRWRSPGETRRSVSRPPWDDPARAPVRTDGGWKRKLRSVAGLVAESLEVGLVEWPVPREALAFHHPCAIPPLRAHDDAGQVRRAMWIAPRISSSGTAAGWRAPQRTSSIACCGAYPIGSGRLRCPSHCGSCSRAGQPRHARDRLITRPTAWRA